MTCFVCQRAPIRGLTFNGKPTCAHCAPHSLAGEMMISFSETEVEGLAKGGAAAGQYLDSIGKTDLAVLSDEEWDTFLCRVLGGYSEFMQAEVKKYPPF